MRIRRETKLRHAMRLLQAAGADHTHTLQEESMNYKRKFKRQRRARQAQPSFWVPAEFKDRIVRMFLADPGRFAGSQREFAWRELKRSVEERKRREAGA